MCQSVKRLTFCTCEVDPSFFKSETSTKDRKKGPGRYSKITITNQEASEAEEFVWVLARYVSTSVDLIELGRIIFPKESLGMDLTVENVLKELNSRNCFDFDFDPVDQDCLTIETKGFGAYMAFYFQGGQWRKGWSHDTFNDEMRKLGTGYVRWLDGGK